MLKGLHHLWNTRETTFRWNQSQCNKCLLCQTEIESWQHVIQCNNEHVVRARNEFLTTFGRGLAAMHTAPELKKWLIYGITSWLSKNEPGEPTMYDINNVNVHEAYCVQKEIGFDSLMQGLIAKEMRLTQEKYYVDAKCPVKYNGIRWMKYVTQSLLEFCHNMWTERCAVVVASTNDIHERRQRMRAWTRLNEIWRNKWMIPAVCRDLVNHDKKFFLKAPYLQIEMWLVRLNSAIEQGKNADDICDIRSYGTQVRQVSGSRRVHTKKKYNAGLRKRQQDLFNYF